MNLSESGQDPENSYPVTARPEVRQEAAERRRRTAELMVPEAQAATGLNDEGGFFATRVDALVDWARKNSLWPLPLGLSCCAIEFMATASSKFDMARFGAEVARFSPRQADVLIVAGTCTYKMAESAKRVFDQMAEPKWVISMGACASSGGMYRCYSVVQGIDTFLPVDFYISGCPPRPENVLNCLMKLQEKISLEKPSAELLGEKPAQP